jgi:hypothetical protein
MEDDGNFKGKTMYIALFVQVATQVVQVQMVREGGLAKLCNIATRKAFLDIRRGGESQCYNSYT